MGEGTMWMRRPIMLGGVDDSPAIKTTLAEMLRAVKTGTRPGEIR